MFDRSYLWFCHELLVLLFSIEKYNTRSMFVFSRLFREDMYNRNGRTDAPFVFVPTWQMNYLSAYLDVEFHVLHGSNKYA